jgi:hypothetical protein
MSIFGIRWHGTEALASVGKQTANIQQARGQLLLMAAPSNCPQRVGAENDAVFRGLLGLSTEDLALLVKAGVIA